jgi:hypothetical protein
LHGTPALPQALHLAFQHGEAAVQLVIEIRARLLSPAPAPAAAVVVVPVPVSVAIAVAVLVPPVERLLDLILGAPGLARAELLVAFEARNGGRGRVPARGAGRRRELVMERALVADPLS